MTDNVLYEGGCSCRKLRFRITADPLIVHARHCRQGQRVTGSAFVKNALIEKEKVEFLSGEIARFHFPDTYHTAYFCRKCATFAWSECKSSRFEDCWFMRVGALDEPDHAPPNVHIFIESRQPWVVIPEEVPSIIDSTESRMFVRKAALIAWDPAEIRRVERELFTAENSIEQLFSY